MGESVMSGSMVSIVSMSIMSGLSHSIVGTWVRVLVLVLVCKYVSVCALKAVN